MKNMKNKQNNNNSTKYSVIKPNIKTWIIYIILIILLSMGYLLIFFRNISQALLPPEIDIEFQLDEIFWGLLVPNICVILISPIIWNKISDIILSEKWVKSYSESSLNMKNHLMPLRSLLSIKPKPVNEYYLELNTVNTDLTKIGSIFKKKILGAIAGSIGLTFIGASILRAILTSGSGAFDSLDVLFLSIMLMQIIPLAMSLFIPVNWTLNDIALNYKSDEYFVQNVGDDMSNGIFRKFIGIGGFILGLNVCYNLAYSNQAPWFINLWVSLIYFIFFYILVNAGTIIAIALSYLIYFHETKVNDLRNKFLNIIALGETHVKGDISESTETDIKDLHSKEEKSLILKIFHSVIVLFILGLAIFGEFYVLFIVGPFTFGG